MNYTIAIADDEEMMRKGLTTMIPWREWGYEVVVTAPSGRALIEALEKESVDVVLTDITMDDMTGLDVAKYVHDNLPDTVTVVISGYVEFDFAQEALKQGVFKYLLKPVSLEDMRALAEELVPEIERRRRITHLENQYWNGYLKPVDRFIAEGARGALKEEREMKSRAAFFGIEEGFLDRKCMMMSFILSLPTDDRLDPPSVFQAIFQRLDPAADCHVIYCEGGWVRALLTSARADALPGAEDADAFSQILAHRLCIHESIDSALVYVEKVYDDVFSFLKEGFDDWDLPVLADQERDNADYDRQDYRHAFISAVKEGDEDRMRSNLLCYLLVCSQPSHGIWHARFMVRVLLWQMAEIIGGGGESLVFVPDEHAIMRAGDAQQLCDLVMTCYQNMLARRADMEKARDPVERVKEYIESHFDKDISLIGLSEEVYVAPAYLSRLFHERTGVTYTEYLNMVRLNEAARLLKTGDASVSEIAACTGFRDQKYFARRFKQRYGATPSEFREKGEWPK